MLKFFILLLFSLNTAYSQDYGSYWIYNQDTKIAIGGKSTQQQRPIASITKLMTALLVVESVQPLDTEIKYQGWIWQKKSVSRRELLESLLIRSDNAAAESLAAGWAGGRKEFIEQMNRRARSLGMNNTKFDDPSGLSAKNISNVEDVAKLIGAASRHEIIRKISISKYIQVERDTKQKINRIEIPNTNQGLLFEFDNIILSKTGFTNKAGWCLALMVEKSNQNYIIVILGEPNPQSRADKARHLINNYVNIQEKDYINENWFHLFNF